MADGGTIVGNIQTFGQQIQYQLLETIDQGSLSQLFRAQTEMKGNDPISHWIAVRQVCASERDTRQFLQRRFNRYLPELWKSLLKLRHHNVVCYYGLTVEWINGGVTAEITMEYPQEGNLAQFLAKQEKSGERIPRETLFRFAVQITEGLQAVHKHDIIHTDLNSRNILLFTNNRDFVVKIGGMDNPVDLQRCISESINITEYRNTARYMSPEMAQWLSKPHGESVCRKTDIWSLGCVFLDLANSNIGNNELCFANGTTGESFVLTDRTTDYIIISKLMSGYVPIVTQTIPNDLACLIMGCLNKDILARKELDIIRIALNNCAVSKNISQEQGQNIAGLKRSFETTHARDAEKQWNDLKSITSRHNSSRSHYIPGVITEGFSGLVAQALRAGLKITDSEPSDTTGKTMSILPTAANPTSSRKNTS